MTNISEKEEKRTDPKKKTRISISSSSMHPKQSKRLARKISDASVCYINSSISEETLPVEIWQRIFSHCDIQTLLIVSRVSKWWCTLSWGSQTFLDFSKESLCVYNFVVNNYTSYMDNLKFLSLPQCIIPSQSFTIISDLKHLKKLSFQWTDTFLASDLEHLSKLKNLKHLSITSGSQLGSASLNFLKNLTTLEHLKIEMFQRNILSKYDDLLLELTNLRILDLSWCKNISTSTLEKFKYFSNLQTLIFDMCFDFSDECLKCVSNMENIEVLSLRWCHCITDSGIEHLSNMTSLRHLNVSNCPHVTPKGLSVLNELCNVIFPNHQI